MPFKELANDIDMVYTASLSADAGSTWTTMVTSGGALWMHFDPATYIFSGTPSTPASADW